MADIVRGLCSGDGITLLGKSIDQQQAEFPHGHFVHLPGREAQPAPDTIEGAQIPGAGSGAGGSPGPSLAGMTSTPATEARKT